MSDGQALKAFRKYGDTVLRAAYAVTGSYHEAEDITQEVFLKLHASPQNFENDDHMKAWLLRVTVNRSKNFRKSFLFSRTSGIDEIPESALKCEFTEEENEIRELIKNLPEKYASVIYLYYYEGFNVREIAEILEKSENTVSSLLQRGRRKLRTEIEREGYAYES